jgi:starvation-inducible outer membrane lipoprotein
MQNLLVIMRVCFLAACDALPKNLAGSSFDADSAYCRQLWKSAPTFIEITLIFH